MQFPGYEPVAHIGFIQPSKRSLFIVPVVSLETQNDVDFIGP